MPYVSILIEFVGFIDLSAGITRAMLLSAGGKGITGAGTWLSLIVGFYVLGLIITQIMAFSMSLRLQKRLASAPYGAAAR